MKNIYRGFLEYLWRWLLLGSLGGLFKPIYENLDHFWIMKAWQLSWGLLFGLVCAAIFTPAQNSINPKRNRPITWIIAMVVWILVKLGFAYFAK